MAFLLSTANRPRLGDIPTAQFLNFASLSGSVCTSSHADMQGQETCVSRGHLLQALSSWLVKSLGPATTTGCHAACLMSGGAGGEGRSLSLFALKVRFTKPEHCTV